jgi:hypothetical protein
MNQFGGSINQFGTVIDDAVHIQQDSTSHDHASLKHGPNLKTLNQQAITMPQHAFLFSTYNRNA